MALFVLYHSPLAIHRFAIVVLHGQPHLELRALSRFAGHFDSSFVRLHNPFRQGKPQACPFFSRREKRLENLRQRIASDSLPRIPDSNHRPLSFLPQSHFDFPLVVNCLKAVEQQVEYDLLNLDRVVANPWQLFVGVKRDLQSVWFEPVGAPKKRLARQWRLSP
jgi:hypothetical protein